VVKSDDFALYYTQHRQGPRQKIFQGGGEPTKKIPKISKKYRKIALFQGGGGGGNGKKAKKKKKAQKINC